MYALLRRFSPNSLLWGSLLEEKSLAAICSGRVSGACPPCVRHCPPCVRRLSALCMPWVRLATPPNLVRLVSARLMCAAPSPHFVRHVPALCQLKSTMCPRGLLWGKAVASWSKILSALPNPPRLYCMPAGQFPWHLFGLHKFRPCKRTLRLKNCLGSMLVYFVFCFVPQTVYCGVLSWEEKSLAAICSGHVPELARHVSATCLPCVCLVSRLESALAAPPKPCPPCVRRVTDLRQPWMCPPWVRFGRGSKPCPPCVRRVTDLRQPWMCPPWVRFGRGSKPCLSAKALALLLDFVRSWPAVGQGRGIIRQSFFAPLHNQQRL